MRDAYTLSPEKVAEGLQAFGDDGDGLAAGDIVILLSHLIHTGGIALLDLRYQQIAAHFIADGVLDFSGNLLMDESELFYDDDTPEDGYRLT